MFLLATSCSQGYLFFTTILSIISSIILANNITTAIDSKFLKIHTANITDISQANFTKLVVNE